MDQPEVVFKAYLDQKGVNFTDAHRDVCAAVFEIHRHFTLYQLSEQFRGKLTSREVERILDQMILAGLMRRIVLKDNLDHYEHTYGHVPHDHLVCQETGKVIEFTSEAVKEVVDQIAALHGYRALRHSLRIEVGPCEDDQGKRRDYRTLGRPYLPFLPLNMLGVGKRGEVMMIRGNQKVVQRLANMGLREGDVIEVLQNTFAGPLTLRIRNTRIALGHGLAHKITVKEV